MVAQEQKCVTRDHRVLLEKSLFNNNQTLLIRTLRGPQKVFVLTGCPY